MLSTSHLRRRKGARSRLTAAPLLLNGIGGAGDPLFLLLLGCVPELVEVPNVTSSPHSPSSTGTGQSGEALSCPY